MILEFERIADLKRTSFIIQSLKDHCRPGAEVLDIGCGNGIITRAVGQEGYKVLGIDMDARSIENARNANAHANVSFELLSVETLAKSRPQYAAIICSEVLEHLSEPSKLLDVVHTLLKDDGILIVTVPNGNGPRELFVTRPIQRLQQKNGWLWKMVSSFKSGLGYKGVTVQSASDDLTHLQFFTLKSLKVLAAATGFSISKIVASNFIEQVFPFSLLFKRSKRLQRIDCQLSDKLPLSFTSGFMSIWKKIKE